MFCSVLFFYFSLLREWNIKYCKWKLCNFRAAVYFFWGFFFLDQNVQEQVGNCEVVDLPPWCASSLCCAPHHPPGSTTSCTVVLQEKNTFNVLHSGIEQTAAAPFVHQWNTNHYHFMTSSICTKQFGQRKVWVICENIYPRRFWIYLFCDMAQ